MMSSYQTSVSIKHIPGKSWLSVKATPNRDEKKKQQQEGKSNCDEKQPATQLNLMQKTQKVILNKFWFFTQAMKFA